MKRLVDVVLAAVAAVVLSPVLLAAAIGVKMSSRGPVLYRAKRVGKDGELFTLHKFRTMRNDAGGGSRITATDDPRIFRVGALLRKTKIDELPQLFDILRGVMSVVGPRPEDPDIVALHYTEADRTTLDVLPGLLSPGSIYYYTTSDPMLMGTETEADYVRELLPIKLALDRVYIERQSTLYDLRLMVKTAYVIVRITAGRRDFEDPPEMPRALELLAER